MRRLCIIACGAKKIWDVLPEAKATEAQHVYQSAFHKASQAYARTFFQEWAILSAKHGFLLPSDIVPENYDLAFGTKSEEIVTIDELIRQAQDKQLDDVDEVVMLGGKKFTGIMHAVFGEERSHFPLADCKGIGFMLQKLNKAVADKEEIGKG
ncbi:DUF6884 domain-containing protein [Brevibacillus parabrevis]|uniref:DUF6884 domain-containing protein n=1 Tax=Brevibacillus parabrevis TaxID=54914 RepID=A0A4Y3PBZ0_BREPA|nr:DUF6884 domain-containing protein [Brevibacillus parabrevis]MED2255097.1 hypothetical protein [Brevibacillus parabrevis]RNB93058.1 hypothetical protein EDM60_24540 [Brevibacillus parabrevis]WDV96196.1 hypothetical protein PSE45_04355 [Brevibacillus parabrevis]GEB32060.1 hypothetical protein BPA01_16400 [Brevibacillus parabrevis]